MQIRKMLKSDGRRAFRSGDPDLDLFFHRYAGKNQLKLHIGVTYVATEDSVISGYVTLAGGQISVEELPGVRALPRYPLPVLRIARLAVAVDWQGRGVGSSLMGFAVRVALQQREDVGCIGLVTDAKADAVAFYRKNAFVVMASPQAPGAPTPMFLGLGTVDR